MCIEETTLYKMHLVIDTDDTQPATMLSPVDWSQGPMKFFSLNALGPTCTNKASLNRTGGKRCSTPSFTTSQMRMESKKALMSQRMEAVHKQTL